MQKKSIKQYMKSILTLLFLALSFYTFAQTDFTKSRKNQKHKDLYSMFRSLNANQVQQKTSALDDRLIAEVSESQFFNDSTAYSYSGNRGSMLLQPFYLEFDDIKFDERIFYNSSTAPSLKTAQTFNGGNKVILSIDSVFDGSGFIPSLKISYTYNANNQLLTKLNQAFDPNSLSFINSFKTDYTYSGNNLLSEIGSTWNGVDWDFVEKSDYTYVGLNATSITNSTWENLAWEFDFRALYTFDVNNRETSQVFQSYFNSLWVNDFKLSFTYSTGNLPNSAISQEWDGTRWENFERFQIIIANGRIIEILNQEWIGNSWDFYGRQLLSYNSNGYMLTQQSESWDGTIFQFDTLNDFRVRFYYEQYDNTSSVNQINNSKSQFKVYPNPANDLINIKFTDNINAQYRVKITTLLGATVYENLDYNPQYTDGIDVSELSKSMYLIYITGAENQTEVIKFVKE